MKITENSIASVAGLRVGDAILKINDIELGLMEHSRAKQEIIRAGNEFYLTVQRWTIFIYYAIGLNSKLLFNW